MSNVPETSLELDGAVYNLRFDLNAIRLIEKGLGRSVTALEGLDLDLWAMVSIVHACIVSAEIRRGLHPNDRTTEEQLCSAVSIRDAECLAKIISELFQEGADTKEDPQVTLSAPAT